MELQDQEYSVMYEKMLEGAKEHPLLFCHVMYPQDTNNNTYILSDLHDHLLTLFAESIKGVRSAYQAVSVPPQHGKSQTLTVRAVAWYVGYMKNRSVALTGFSYSLLVGFLKDIKNIVEDPKYARIFPDVYIKGTNTQTEVEFSNGCSILIKPAGSKLTGRPVDLLIMDDVHAGRAEAESKLQRDKVKQWYMADCVSRLSQDAKIFLIGTRWHPEDLIGFLTSDNYRREVSDAGAEEALYDVTNLTAICESPNDPLGRKIGDPLFPAKRGEKFLNRQKATMIAYEWWSQYMGKPIPLAGDQVDTEKLNYITLGEVPTDIEWVRGWDLAITESTQADFTSGALVCAKFGTVEDPITGKPVRQITHLYIINIKKDQLAWAKMREMILVKSLYDNKVYGVNRIGIEAVSGFKAVYEDVKEKLLGTVRVDKMNPTRGGKLLRAQPWLNLVEAGRVYLVRDEWNKDFTDELKVFPVGAHDDQVDSVSIAYEMLANRAQLTLA